MAFPTVYIIGTGPGDPSLISARGLRYLKSADVVIHDHFIHPRLLQAARTDAELIDVGVASPQPLEQEAICLLLTEKAREGKSVVRLKWGDPFVFDSGGRAALFLREHGIPFEIVPGVTALVAVPSYAGIPVTYPGSGDTLTFIRGFEDSNETPPDVDWTSLARLEGTLVCYAGAKQLPKIISSLLSHGRSPDDAAAVIYDGTLPKQRTILGTLASITRVAAEQEARSAGILVVGAVIGLREHLRWFDARPLFGKRILVTRSREHSPELVERLEELGAQAIEAPSIRIQPTTQPAALDAACASAGKYDWIVFTTANAVDGFMRSLLAGPGDARSLKGPLLCATGAEVAERLMRYNVKADLVPVEHRLDAIVDAIGQRRSLSTSRILLLKAEGAREIIGDDLRKAGAAVTEVGAYRVVRDQGQADRIDIYKMLLDREIDVVTFTSPSAVSHLVDHLGAEPAADLLSHTIVASIGPVTAEAAEQTHIPTTVMPTEYTTDGLIRAIVDHFESAAHASSPNRS